MTNHKLTILELTLIFLESIHICMYMLILQQPPLVPFHPSLLSFLYTYVVDEKVRYTFEPAEWL